MAGRKRLQVARGGRRREKNKRSYMSRVRRMTLLAPDIDEANLNGRQPEEIRPEDLLDGSRWGSVGQTAPR